MPSCHRYREWCFALLLLLLTPLALRGQAPDRFFICDPTRDHIVTLRDVDGDGEFNSPGESSIYYSDLSSGPNLSVPVGLNPFKGGLLLLDGGTLDSILWLRDLDGDQTANSEDEWQIFYDNSSPGPDLVVPRAITVASNGEIFIADEGSAARRVLRLFDSNDDGDALDSGESVIYFDSESFSPSVPISEPISIAVGGDGSVYVGDSFHNWVFRCNDFDGDGTANGEELS